MQWSAVREQSREGSDGAEAAGRAAAACGRGRQTGFLEQRGPRLGSAAAVVAKDAFALACGPQTHTHTHRDTTADGQLCVGTLLKGIV